MRLIVFCMLIISSASYSQADLNSTKWKDLEFLIGKWEGTGNGKVGESKVEREYSYLLGGTYIIGKNKSTYKKQKKNPHGEVHVNWDIYSYDKNRKKFVIRQFHEEDITNTFSADSNDISDGEYEFISESIENFGAGWKAKEVYNVISENEFVETFYLAPPGKNYTVFVENRLKRVE